MVWGFETRLTGAKLAKTGRGVINEEFLGRRPAWVGGQISPFDSDFLAGLVAAVKPQRSVEIGVASGWSSAVLLQTLNATVGNGAKLTAIDLSDTYYLDKSVPTGKAVDEMVPHLKRNYELKTGRLAFDVMEEVGSVDFAFIDAHHMHPWATLDLISVLPFLSKGSWVALHDINLCRIERHRHMNRGPFYLFHMWPSSKLESIQELPMIGAICLDDSPEVYLPFLLEVLCTPWEVPVDGEALGRLADNVRQHFGGEWGEKFRSVFNVMGAARSAAP